MSSAAPLWFEWTDDGAMKPLARFNKMADAQFVVGEKYCLVPHEDRSMVSHNHEFGWLKDAWLNLPEDIAPLYPSPEHLRKRALIEGGFYDETAIDTGTKAGALRVASAIRAREEFSLVIVQGPYVIIRTAKSQSRRAMNREQFSASKQAIIEIVSNMIGVRPEELTRRAA